MVDEAVAGLMHLPMTPTETFDEVVTMARRDVPFYRDLMAGLRLRPTLSELPLTDVDSYWQTHSEDRRNILSTTQKDGFVLNSSGTSGIAKHSYFTMAEWEEMTALSARSFQAAGLQDGDRMGNLFASGNLYASLLFASDSIKRMSTPVVQFPIGYSFEFESVAETIQSFQLNVLAGFPTHLFRVINSLDAKGASTKLDHLVYAGEMFTDDQQRALRVRHPGLRFHSAGYASVDSGPIAFADAGCTGSEHRTYDAGSFLEIVDEQTGEVIRDANRSGRIVFTSLIRRLMPLLRYPTGDRGEWLEPSGTPNRKFKLLGRVGQMARVGVYNVEVAELVQWLEPLRTEFGIEQSQMVITRRDLVDQLTIRLAGGTDSASQQEGTRRLLEIIAGQRPDMVASIEAQVIHPLQVEWVMHEDLIVNERSGKLLSIVDHRDKHG